MYFLSEDLIWLLLIINLLSHFNYKLVKPIIKTFTFRLACSAFQFQSIRLQNEKILNLVYNFAAQNPSIRPNN